MSDTHRDEIAKLEALYASNPEGRVFTHLAEAYRKAGERERAHQVLTEGLHRHPDSASAYVVLGRVLADDGDVDGGLAAFQHALERDAGNFVALRWLGDLSVRAGRIDDAISHYHELLARDPADSELQERLSILEADRAIAMSGNAGVEAEPAPEEEEEERGEPVDDVPPETGSFEDVFAELVVGETRGDVLEGLGVEDEIASGSGSGMGEEGDFSLEGFGEIELGDEGGGGAELSLAPGERDGADEVVFDEPAFEGDGGAELSLAPGEGDGAEAGAEGFVLDDLEPGYVEAVGGEPTELETEADLAPVATPVTETMAELYRNQGFPERAADVYRQLLREKGDDPRLQALLSEIELEQGRADGLTADGEHLLEQDDTGELWLSETKSPWLAGEDGSSSSETPYAWPNEGAEEAGPPIGSYFATLLQWQPAGRTAEQEAGGYTAPPGEDDLLVLDAAMEAPPAEAGPADLVPWELPPANEAPASEGSASEAPASDAPAEELMPWETAPAAAAPSPESQAPERTEPEATPDVQPWTSADDNTAAAAGQAPEAEDDEDLEMFRSWLQSLKK